MVLTEQWKAAYREYLAEEDKSINDDIESTCKELAESQVALSRSLALLEAYYSGILNEFKPTTNGRPPEGQHLVLVNGEWVYEPDPNYNNPNARPGKPLSVTNPLPKNINIDGPKSEQSATKPEKTDKADRRNGNSDTPGVYGTSSSNPNTTVNINTSTGRDTAKADEAETRKNDASINDIMKTLIGLGSTAIGDGKNYAPAATYTYQKISNMKFPENVIFFLGQLIKWIKNVVVYFIGKFRNIIRRILKMPELELDDKSLDLQFVKAKKIEQVSSSIDLGRSNRDFIKMYRVQPSDIQLLESDDTLKALNEDDKEGYVVTIDLSRDILQLKELVQHFYSLFDQAYGSNNEKLFATDDLEVVLSMFKESLARTTHGDVNAFSVGSTMIDASVVNKDRVRQNLILTNQNIENLKAAYVQTAAKIKDITKIVSSKEMLMMSDLGVNYRLLTSSTYAAMKNVLDSFPLRLKEATKMERDLKKIEQKYMKLQKEIYTIIPGMKAYSSVSFQDNYTKQLQDLLTATNWMTQLVQLRLAGLGMYIKELKDVRDALSMVANVNHK